MGVGEGNLVERDRGLAVGAFPADTPLETVQRDFLVEDMRQLDIDRPTGELHRPAFLGRLEAARYTAQARPAVLLGESQISEPSAGGVALRRRRLAAPLQRALRQRASRVVPCQ